MQKKYVVRLTNQEREELQSVVKKLKGTGQKVRRVTNDNYFSPPATITLPHLHPSLTSNPSGSSLTFALESNLSARFSPRVGPLPGCCAAERGGAKRQPAKRSNTPAAGRPLVGASVRLPQQARR